MRASLCRKNALLSQIGQTEAFGNPCPEAAPPKGEANGKAPEKVWPKTSFGGGKEANQRASEYLYMRPKNGAVPLSSSRTVLSGLFCGKGKLAACPHKRQARPRFQPHTFPSTIAGMVGKEGISETSDPTRMNRMPMTMLVGMASRRKAKASTGARAGLKKKTNEAVIGEVASIAIT